MDSNASVSTLTLALGDSIGEYNHRLNIDEMPSHKHGSNDVTGNTNGNGNTTTEGLHAHSITDPGHAHTYRFPGSQNSTPLTDTASDNDFNNSVPETSSNSATGITINSNGSHFHTIGSTGGSNYHNNIQPMIGLGNMFIFSGKYMYPSDASVPFAGYPYLSNSQIL